MASEREERLLAERRRIVDEVIIQIHSEQKEMRVEHKEMRDWITGTKSIIDLFKWMIPVIAGSALKLIFDIITFFVHK